MAIARLSVKVGSVGKAQPHADYISREGKYKDRLDKGEKLEATDTGNMPAWAAHDSRAFWQAADTYERKNGSTYREHEIALPRELSPDQRLDLVNDWVKSEIGQDHAYQFAIHTPTASDGEEQPHCHLMFCERKHDGIARDPDQYFKRYNKKNPERGGAQKTNFSMKSSERRDALKAQRERWQTLCNDHLKQAGHEVEIDMRSYADQSIEKTPEPKMLPSEWQRSEQKKNIIALRESRKEQRVKRAVVKQLIPDTQTEITRLQKEQKLKEQLKPDVIEKTFNRILSKFEEQQTHELERLVKELEELKQAQNNLYQNKPVAPTGMSQFFSRANRKHKTALEEWEQESRQLQLSMQKRFAEKQSTELSDPVRQALEQFKANQPEMSKEWERLQAIRLENNLKKAAEEQKHRAQEKEKSQKRLETLAREKQLEQERLKQAEQKERDKLELERKQKQEQRERTRVAKKEGKANQQKFYADVLRRQDPNEIAKYPALETIQRDAEKFARRTEQPLDEIIDQRARSIETGVRRVGLSRSRGRGGLEL